MDETMNEAGTWDACLDLGPLGERVTNQYVQFYFAYRFKDTSTSTPPCAPGALSWCSAGPIAGMHCTQIHEAADPNTWDDNYLCSARDEGFRWSSAGPIAGMRCTQIHEVADPHTWSDNYLCVPEGSRFHFTWSSAGPVGGTCVQFLEPADPDAWTDNYLCY